MLTVQRESPAAHVLNGKQGHRFKTRPILTKSNMLTSLAHRSQIMGAFRASTTATTLSLTQGPMPSPGMRVTVLGLPSPGLGMYTRLRTCGRGKLMQELGARGSNSASAAALAATAQATRRAGRRSGQSADMYHKKSHNALNATSDSAGAEHTSFSVETGRRCRHLAVLNTVRRSLIQSIASVKTHR